MSSKVEEWTVLSMLEWGTDYFKEKGIPDPRHSIEWLLAEVLGIRRLDLYLKFDRPLSKKELEAIRPLIKRRARHEPLQYIIGHTDFMNAQIRVSPDVLIPRIETEQLVELILDDFPDNSEEEEISVIDIGTGSGCIPIALKMERPHWKVTAMDLSPEALEVARKNAEENEVDIHFMEGDIRRWKEINLSSDYHIIVSNPPYVLPDEKDLLEKQVVEYEPALALFHEDPPELYGDIIHFASEALRPDGRLYLEIHEHYHEQILGLFSGRHWQARLKKDYEKKPRFILADPSG